MGAAGAGTSLDRVGTAECPVGESGVRRGRTLSCKVADAKNWCRAPERELEQGP